MHSARIVDAVRTNLVTCIQGETGCGKSSRVPQYIYHFCREKSTDVRVIVITQPRRLACITLATRVAQEMGEKGGLQADF